MEKEIAKLDKIQDELVGYMIESVNTPAFEVYNRAWMFLSGEIQKLVKEQNAQSV